MSIYNMIYIQKFAPNDWNKEIKYFISTLKYDNIEADSEEEASQKAKEMIRRNNFNDEKGSINNIFICVEIIK